LFRFSYTCKASALSSFSGVVETSLKIRKNSDFACSPLLNKFAEISKTCWLDTISFRNKSICFLANGVSLVPEIITPVSGLADGLFNSVATRVNSFWYDFLRFSVSVASSLCSLIAWLLNALCCFSPSASKLMIAFSLLFISANSSSVLLTSCLSFSSIASNMRFSAFLIKALSWDGSLKTSLYLELRYSRFSLLSSLMDCSSYLRSIISSRWLCLRSLSSFWALSLSDWTLLACSGRLDSWAFWIFSSAASIWSLSSRERLSKICLNSATDLFVMTLASASSALLPDKASSFWASSCATSPTRTSAVWAAAFSASLSLLVASAKSLFCFSMASAFCWAFRTLSPLSLAWAS